MILRHPPTSAATIDGFQVYGKTNFWGPVTQSANIITIDGDFGGGTHTSASYIAETYTSLGQLRGRTLLNYKGIDFNNSFQTTAPSSTHLWTNSSNRLFYGSDAVILNGGNTLGGVMTLGTNDANNLQLETNNTTRVFISGSGNVGIGTTSPTERLHVDGNLLVTGRITAEEFHTEFVSASIIYQSGSTQFGNSLDDTHIFTGSLRVNGSITGSLYGTASWAENAQTATLALTASSFSGQNFATFTQSVASTTWTFNHNLNFRTPVITVYDNSYQVVVPDSIQGTSDNQSVITFSTARAGYASATVGSVLPNNALSLMIAYSIVL